MQASILVGHVVQRELAELRNWPRLHWATIGMSINSHFNDKRQVQTYQRSDYCRFWYRLRKLV